MFLLRLFLVLLFVMLARRIWLSYQSAQKAAEQRRKAREQQARTEAAQRKDLDDLTQQDISDADFEEIP